MSRGGVAESQVAQGDLVRLDDVAGLDDSSAKARAEGGGGIDGDLGCVEAESAQSTARISRCARWMHPEGVAAAAPWPAASSPQAWA
jgi:hypothetical protein